MHIGMIAMSGVRVCDPELLRLGLTLPGFVDRSRVIAALPSLGLLTLAGMTPPPHTVEYLEVPDVRVMSDLPARFDLVAISSYTAQIREAYELASRYRQAGVPVVIGGPHVTAVPEEAARFCDAVAIGEGPRYRESIRRIQSHGISVNGCFVLGLDGHDTSVFDDVFDFVAETELYEVQITVMTAFPGTPLYTRLKKEGRVIDAASWEKCTLFDVNYRPSQMSPEELTQGFKELMGRLYNGELTTRRKRNFFRRYRAAAVTVAGGPGRESMVQASAAVAHAVAEAEIHWS